MKKILFPIIILLLLISLAACGAAPSTDTTASAQTTPDPAVDRQMPAQTTLLIGTLLLEDTAQAVTAEQAQQLLLLWKAVKSMSAADNVAQAELDALYTQIEEAMTADQMAAIHAMTIDGQTIRDLMTELGVDMVQNAPGANGGSPDENFPMPGGDMPGAGAEGGGGFVEGGGPGGGGGPGFAMGGGEGGQQLTESQRATLIAGRGENGSPRSFGMNLILIDPLLQLLQERAAQ